MLTWMPSKKSAANRALGDAIRAARKREGDTQESFAMRAGIDRSYYGAIERGEFNVTIDTLMTISVGLGISATELFKRAHL
jgi:transcriptional regulator with XRE-family HTH domain